MSSSDLNKKYLNNEQYMDYLYSPNSYIPNLIYDYSNKEEYYNSVENSYNNNDNKINNSLFNCEEKTTKINSKDITHNNLTKELIISYIDIKNNPDEKPLSQLRKDKSKSEKKKRVEGDKKKWGRKIFRNVENREEHTKYSDDNMRRKCKHLLLKYSLEFINEQINIAYNGKIGHSIFKKELKIINQRQIIDATIKFNKLFLNKKLSEIFSENISKKYSNLPSNHNKILINKLLNEEDLFKKIYFERLFNLTFMQCLKHFRGEECNPFLVGLKCFNDIKEQFIEKYKEDGEEYVKALEHYINQFEIITNNKRPRKLRKQMLK